ncbi:unnamed protein product [Rotaria sp. Silwood2]|nr:unnamed protein product [Rotaria sp. Silwood2]
MISSNPDDERWNERCKYDDKCEELATHDCQGCGEIYCISHYWEHQTKLQDNFENILRAQDLLRQQLKSLLSQLSTDALLDLIKQIYEFQIKSNEFEKTANIIQQKLQNIINDDKQDFKKHLMAMINRFEVHDHNGYLENDIDCLKKDIEKLKLKLEEIQNYNKKRTSQEQVHIEDMKVQSDNLSEKMKSPLMNLVTQNRKRPLHSVVDTSKYRLGKQADDTTGLFHLFIRRMSPSVLDANENELALTDVDNEMDLDEKEETMMVIDSNTTSKISHKIRFSNNIVRWLRGPFRVMVDGTMHVVDLCAQGTRISDNVVQAVKQELARQKKETAIEQETASRSVKQVFAEITPDWTFEGGNTDRGFTSESIWMRDPQGRRVLVKTQDHPLCAANERLAYTLGGLLGLPINEVQIAIYQNKLVTLHTDVANENEKSVTFMDLPKQIRKKLLTNPILESMDLFDRIVHNVDRNQRNILITVSKTDALDDENTKLKMHLIDHASCFGLGKLNVISIIACKFHSNHLSVVTFDPIEKAKKFEQYLNKLPIADRALIKKTLRRFAAITDDQFDSCITEVQSLLSSSQYNRIHDVLYRQRDVAKRYVIYWSNGHSNSNLKPNQTNSLSSETSDTVVYF